MHPFRILVILAGMLAVGIFSIAATELVQHRGATPFPGWTDARQGSDWVVSQVSPTGPAADRLRVGDRLVSLNGDTLVARYGAAVHRRTLSIGEPYTLTVERSGRDHVQTLTVAAGEKRLASLLVWIAVSLVWVAVGLFIGYARPGDPVARLACAAAVSTGVVYVQVSLFPGIPGALYQPLHVVLGYHFFYRFPGGVRRGWAARGLLWALYAWGVSSAGLRQSLNLAWLLEGPGAAAAWAARHQELFALNRVLTPAMVFPMVFGMVGLITYTYVKLDDPQKRRRIRWVMIGSAVALVPLFLWAGVAQAGALAAPGESPVPPDVRRAVDLFVNAVTVVIPVTVAYAVVKHRIFDISVVIRRGLQYLLARRALQAMLGLPILVLLVTAVTHRDDTIEELVAGNLGYLVVIAATGLSLRYRDRLTHWLDRRFFREQYDRELVLQRVMDDLVWAREPAEVSALVRTEVEAALHPSEVRLWFEGDPDRPPEELLTRLAGRDRGRVRPLATGEASGEALPDRICVAVPFLNSEERLDGLLLLGEKRSQEPYSPGDLSLLGALARQAAVVRENLLLRQRIGDERRVRVDVLAHLHPDRANLVKECPTCGTCYDSGVERCARDGRELDLSLPVTRVVADRYRLDRLIGRGGMGAVYEALDLRLRRRVAIKFLLGQTLGREQALRRFRREARAIAAIRHPNIVEVFDYGSLEPHGAFLVMERIWGVTLREELDRRSPLSGAGAAEWFEPILNGVAAAHEEGVIHRDLKPENVVRSRPEPGPPVVRILDFGVAKVRPTGTMDGNLTATGVVVGTSGYMSPEQLRGQDVDERSDIFAIGVMVAEAVAGRRPFTGATFDELLLAILLEPYRLPGDAPEFRALDSVLQRCLAKDPADRFVSATALRRDLIPALCACSTLAVGDAL
ncbi:MAG: protein kinase [Longimicrobiales bacterium]|nr:protein kinase [Longimicrobiales bacterium]